MKTQSIEWTNINNLGATIAGNPVGRLNSAMSLVTKAFLALVPAVAIVVGAAWLITAPDLVVYLQATLWASGFVFLGLAIDSEKSVASLSLVTGIALPVLAVLSSRVAVEIAIVAAVLVAAWVAAAIWRR
jgi:hypothetical protein